MMMFVKNYACRNVQSWTPKEHTHAYTRRKPLKTDQLHSVVAAPFSLGRLWNSRSGEFWCTAASVVTEHATTRLAIPDASADMYLTLSQQLLIFLRSSCVRHRRLHELHANYSLSSSSSIL